MGLKWRGGGVCCSCSGKDKSLCSESDNNFKSTCCCRAELLVDGDLNWNDVCFPADNLPEKLICKLN